MTAIVSLFGIIGRFAGDLLNTATGWAGTLMFGRVPQSHRRYLSAMLGGSVLWIVLVIGFLVPGLLVWGLSTTPHPSFITSSWLAFVVTLGVILVPLGVGAAAWLAPADDNRAKGIRGALEPLRGYILAPAIGGLLVFLAGVGIVRKARSARHRWSDTHIPIVVPPKGYDDTVGTLQVALADAGFPLKPRAGLSAAEPAGVGDHPPGGAERPASPPRSHHRAARRRRPGGHLSVRRRRLHDGGAADPDPRDDPGGAGERGCPPHDGRRGAGVEDRLKAISAGGQDGHGLWRQAPELADIAGSLLTLDVPNDEWDVLYRLRLQAERDLLRRRSASGRGDGPLADPRPGHGRRARRRRRWAA